MTTASEILKKVKAAFLGEPTPIAPAAPVEAAAPNIISYPVDGGQPVYTDISDDNINGIDANDAVFSDPALTIPYPDGTYMVTGTTFGFTVSSGSVSAVNDPDGTGAGMPMVAAAEVPAAATPAAPAVPSVEERLTAIESALAQLISPVTQMATEQQLLAASAKIERHEATIKGLFELVEKLVEQPTEEPKTLTGKRKENFDRMNEASARQARIAEHLKTQRALA